MGKEQVVDGLWIRNTVRTPSDVRVYYGRHEKFRISRKPQGQVESVVLLLWKKFRSYVLRGLSSDYTSITILKTTSV